MATLDTATTFSIGFTEKSAQEFFSLLRNHKVRRLVDVRLNNSSQLAGFSKKEDLRFFVKEICGIEYVELRELAPEPGPLKDYRKKLIDWARYESMYIWSCWLGEQWKQILTGIYWTALAFCVANTNRIIAIEELRWSISMNGGEIY